ncbi:MAG: T9SS type A sorting domain-containing protein [Bacteroidales bacterium]|nr:T9SS type A sorting domain-containing protein [Bacteroidales bacterium]
MFDEISSGSYYLETVQDMFPENWNGIKNSMAENNIIKIFPNPCEGDFFIQTDVIGKLNLDIYNAFGEKVYTEKYFTNGMNQQKNIRLNSSPGVYFIRINTIKKSYTSFVIKR